MEVMVASMILVVAMMGVFGGLKRGYELVELSRDETRVSQILQSEIEDLRTHNWDYLAGLTADSTYEPDNRFTQEFGNRYSCRRIITNRATDQKQVQLIVSWTDVSGVTHQRDYITWITKNGVYDYYYRSF